MPKHRRTFYPNDAEQEMIYRLSNRLRISGSAVISQAIWLFASGKAYIPESILADMIAGRPREVPIEVVGPKVQKSSTQ